METIQTGIEGFTIRRAIPEDCDLILQFIRELAEYEKLSHEVVATSDNIREHLFGDQPAAKVLIGEYSGKPVGFALYFYNFSTFLGQRGIYLEDLFVQPTARGKGFGKSLITCLANIAVQEDCGRLEWSVLDWNKPAIDFYQALGASSMEGWIINRVTGDKLNAMARLFEVKPNS